MRDWFRIAFVCATVFLPAVLLPTVKSQAQPPILNAANGEIPPGVDVTPGNSAPVPDGSAPTKREEVVEKLRVAQRTLDSAKEASEQNNAKPPERLQREVELLKQLEVIMAQQESAKTEYADQETRLVDLEAQLATIRESGPPEERPYSFLVLDHLRDELNSKQTRTESVAAAAGGAAEAVTRAKEVLETKQQAFRRAKEVEQGNTDETKKTDLANATKFAELEVRIATETLAVQRQAQANAELAQKVHQAQIAVLEEKSVWISKAVVFSDRDLNEQMFEMDKQEEELRGELREAESNKQYAEAELSRARFDLDAAKEKSTELVERVESKQLSQQLYQNQVSVLNERLKRRSLNREIWQRRFSVIRESATTDELINWSQEARTRLDQLEREKRLEQLKIDEVREDLAGLDKKHQAASEDAIRRLIDAQRATLGQFIQAHDGNIVSIETSRRLTEKLFNEIEGDVKNWTLSEWGESIKHYAGKVWNTEITTVDDHPLTVGKVLVGLILILGGFILARLLSRTLGGRLQHERIGMNESAAAALQSLSFYVLLVGFTLTSLKFVNVPLTMFTFLGGAIAIGVGFGSQNVVNNFISGLILLAERPIKVGDLIQVDDLYGNVEQIGARSTIIRTGDNLDIIVPNSTFLESNVVNLTRGDDKLRTKVCVGIAYGSPTREATRLMKLAATEHGRILKRPEPFVWFTDFGDNSLNFEVHFWVKVRSLSDRTRIESDLRYRIDQLFREAGITIAFPQRDVHFDTTQPISIRVVNGDDEFGLDKSASDAA